MNSNKIVKRFLHISFIFLIFFLTGCAGQRYHKGSAGTEAFGCPLQGRLIVPFGGQEEGVTSKGIVLEGYEGQPVLAAKDGRVAYTDEGLRGYGKTLILEHSGDFSTVYARNAEILVSPGQPVHRGQAIARIGRAGKGGVPRVYFELRHSAKPEDPLRYFK